MDFSPILAGIVLFAGSTALGMANVVKLIQVYEAQHELKRGSAGWIRTLSGWSMIAFWLLTTWFIATVLGDWHASGDLQGAMDRSWIRLRILLEIAAAIGSSD